MNEIKIEPTQVGVIIDDSDVVRGVFRGQGEFVNCIPLIEKAIGEEYGHIATVKGYEYYSLNNTFGITVEIETDGEDEENDLYEFTIQKDALYE